MIFLVFAAIAMSAFVFVLPDGSDASDTEPETDQEDDIVSDPLPEPEPEPEEPDTEEPDTGATVIENAFDDFTIELGDDETGRLVLTEVTRSTFEDGTALYETEYRLYLRDQDIKVEDGVNLYLQPGNTLEDWESLNEMTLLASWNGGAIEARLSDRAILEETVTEPPELTSEADIGRQQMNIGSDGLITNISGYMPYDAEPLPGQVRIGNAATGPEGDFFEATEVRTGYLFDWIEVAEDAETSVRIQAGPGDDIVVMNAGDGFLPGEVIGDASAGDGADQVTVRVASYGENVNASELRGPGFVRMADPQDTVTIELPPQSEGPVIAVYETLTDPVDPSNDNERTLYLYQLPPGNETVFTEDDIRDRFSVTGNSQAQAILIMTVPFGIATYVADELDETSIGTVVFDGTLAAEFDIRY